MQGCWWQVRRGTGCSSTAVGHFLPRLRYVPSSAVHPLQGKDLLLKSNAAGPGLIHAFSSVPPPLTPYAFPGTPFIFAVAEAIENALLLIIGNPVPRVLFDGTGFNFLELEEVIGRRGTMARD